MRVGIIGAGKVGTALGILLRDRGYEISGVASRTAASARRAAKGIGTAVRSPELVSRYAELVFITTSDKSIAPAAAALAATGGFREGQVVIHTSGSLTSDVLQPARDNGALCLSVHPLQSCASVDRAVENIPGSVFSIEGDKEAYTLAERLVADLGGSCFYISKEAKPLYHAAACVASNYLAAVLDLAYGLMAAADMPPELAAHGLKPLIEGTLKNVMALGPVEALTGPIARGDTDTVAEHLQVMLVKAPELVSLYSALGSYTLELAERKEQPPEVAAAARLRGLLRYGRRLTARRQETKFRSGSAAGA